MKWFVTLFLTTSLLLPLGAVACSCVTKGACEVVQSGDVVFLGTVIAKEVGDNRNPDGTVFSPVPSTVRFAVTEAFRGTDANEVEISTTEGCCGCGYPFEVGHSYLVFATRHDGKLSTGMCSATQPAVTAPALMRQLRAARRGDKAAALFGVVNRIPQDARIQGAEHRVPVAGVTVRATAANGAEFTTESDAEGAYEFYDLPPDTYEIRPALPRGMISREQIDNKPLKFTVVPTKSCQQDIWAYWDGRISGRVVSPQGQPISGFVTVEPADPDERREAMKRGGLPGFDTGVDGRFELPLLSPGRYRLRFSPKINGQMNMRRTSYFQPVIDLGEGQHAEDIVFVYTAQP